MRGSERNEGRGGGGEERGERRDGRGWKREEEGKREVGVRKMIGK